MLSSKISLVSNNAKLTENILLMKSMKEKELLDMGLNARRYYNNNFERGYLFDKAENIFEEMR